VLRRARQAFIEDFCARISLASNASYEGAFLSVVVVNLKNEELPSTVECQVVLNHSLYLPTSN
jgi:hypothetical protein